MSDFNNDPNNNYNEVVYTQPEVMTVTPQKKGFAIASLVLGITAIVPGCCCSFVGIILGILAIVFGILFINANKELAVSKGMAMAGIILGGLGILVCVVILIISATMNTENSMEFYQDILDEMNIDVE